MKKAFYDGDKFSPLKTAITALITVTVGGLLSWSIWVTTQAFCAAEAKKKIDHQTTVLHNRITDQERQRDAAVKILGDKIDAQQQMQIQQYQQIMNHLIQIQRDINQ